jgi:hypothetical protein
MLSMQFVDEGVRRSVPVTPRRVSVSVCSIPSRSEPAASGCTFSSWSASALSDASARAWSMEGSSMLIGVFLPRGSRPLPDERCAACDRRLARARLDRVVPVEVEVSAVEVDGGRLGDRAGQSGKGGGDENALLWHVTPAGQPSP